MSRNMRFLVTLESMDRMAFSGRSSRLLAHVGVCALASVVMLAGNSAAATRSGASSTVGVSVERTTAVTELASSSSSSCRKTSQISGFATIGGERVATGKVRVFVRGSKDKLGSFGKEVPVQGSAWTNDMGGFFVAVKCLPKSFVVKITGGRVKSRHVSQSIAALGMRGERGVVVTPTTSIAVEYAKLRHVQARVAVKRVTKYLKVVHLGNDVTHLGSATWVRAKTFSPVKYVAEAKRAGGLAKFARSLAKDISKKSHHTFRPKGYAKTFRPGFPRAGADGTPRTRAASLRSVTKGSSPVSILYSVAGKMAFDAACALLPPSPPTNLACAGPNSSQLTEIQNQLTAISQQLTVLQQSVNDIIATLAVMENQLTEIQTTLAAIEANEGVIEQQNLSTQANQAQQAYQDAYSFAGVLQIQSEVQDATYDLNILGTITPSATWTPVAPGSSNAAICGTMYSQYNLASGQNPLALCTDYLSQTQAFADAGNAYFQSLYQSLVGASGLPQDDLLTYSYQQMLTYGGNAPVSAVTLQSVQASAGQLGVLMDTAYALLGSAQVFEYGATTGDFTSCTDLTTSGTFPADTPIAVSDACTTLESGLFAASVQNSQGVDVAVPPAGSVADPRTNYVWWGYPADLTGATGESGGYPFWPGAPAGTYTTATGTPLELWAYANQYNPACCNTNWLYATIFASNPYPPLLAASPSYNFMLANQSQAQTLFTNLLLTDTSSVAGTLSQSGFQGVGENQYGMEWTNLALNPMVSSIETSLYWQSQTQMPSTMTACTGYPANQTGSYKCVPVTEYSYGTPTTYSGMQDLEGIFASQSWNLETTTLPTASTANQCPVVGVTWTESNQTPANVPMCEEDTFGLMVDTAASTLNGATATALPPFWTAAMFSGPASGGVAAVPVSQPVPVTASS